MKDILIFLFFLVFLSCSELKEVESTSAKTMPKVYDFYFSCQDYIWQGMDTTRICVVDGGKKMFLYTWSWPKGWIPIARRINKDEIYLGRGVLRSSLPDSLLKNLTLFELGEKLYLLQASRNNR